MAGRGNIFISYRRDDAIATAGRLRDRLVSEFGRARVFVDVDDIPHGRDFVKVLEAKVAECEVLLAIIGPRWIDSRDRDGRRRLDLADDFVRIEIGSALQREDIAVIPVLVDGAQDADGRRVAGRPQAARPAQRDRPAQHPVRLRRRPQSCARSRWHWGAGGASTLGQGRGCSGRACRARRWRLSRLADVAGDDQSTAAASADRTVEAAARADNAGQRRQCRSAPRLLLCLPSRMTSPPR